MAVVRELARSVSQFTIAGEGNVSVRDGDAMLIKQVDLLLRR